MTVIANDMMLALLCDEVSKLRLHELLYKTVDSKKKWDGAITPAHFHHHVLQRTFYSYHSSVPDRKTIENRYKFLIPLTFGNLTIEVSYFQDRDKLCRLEFSYNIPPITDRWQMMYRDGISRSTYDGKVQDSEKKFRKTVASKASSLVDGIDAWFPSSQLPSVSEAIVYPYLVLAVGRARLISEMHAQNAAARGLNSHGARINELATEMLKLLLEERDFAPDDYQVCRETY